MYEAMCWTNTREILFQTFNESFGSSSHCWCIVCGNRRTLFPWTPFYSKVLDTELNTYDPVDDEGNKVQERKLSIFESSSTNGMHLRNWHSWLIFVDTSSCSENILLLHSFHVHGLDIWRQSSISREIKAYENGTINISFLAPLPNISFTVSLQAGKSTFSVMVSGCIFTELFRKI